MGTLEDQVAIVTGASRGIGTAIARRLAAAGATVIGTGRNPDTLGEAMAAIAAEGVGSTEAEVFDVADADAAHEAIKAIHGRHGRIDILVNNAGVTADNLIVRMKRDEWRRVMSADLDGVFNVTQPVAKIMLRQRAGRIVMISSVVGLMGNPGQANYAAAKAGLVGMTKSLARELGGRGITVNAIAPGYIATAMTDELTDDQRQALLANTAIPRLGTPEDVAAAVAFLAGPDAAYITGETLNISGGLYM